jgi:hypothetical protein
MTPEREVPSQHFQQYIMSTGQDMQGNVLVNDDHQSPLHSSYLHIIYGRFLQLAF